MPWYNPLLSIKTCILLCLSWTMKTATELHHEGKYMIFLSILLGTENNCSQWLITQSSEIHLMENKAEKREQKANSQ